MESTTLGEYTGRKLITVESHRGEMTSVYMHREINTFGEAQGGKRDPGGICYPGGIYRWKIDYRSDTREK